ncbi:hypothetical protein WH52_07960 [Tenacibaculum holothuriorum]|uniref:Beta-carotene 15,15'-monooxygenase n=1 Tax=Tenacibaculum holothuriorum TaxID=1635173 RepID=A0A1Y2PBW2_9FLAO|nr:hypothetical protein [Tenacibaculum holothuriorum]OSY87963.1 hypothetical protein WH52_07960 [Tenacibaculum holothuriorum]
MRNTINFNKRYLVFGVPLLMILSLVVLLKSPLFIPKLSSFVIIDFLVTIPLVYFFIVRKTSISNKTTISIALLGFVLITILIPEEYQGSFSKFKTLLLPVIELLLIGFVIVKTRVAIKKIRESNDDSKDFFELMQQVCNEILPFGLGTVFASEISVVYYGLFNWKKRTLKENEFTYHKDGMATSVILGFLLVVVVEMFVTHSMMQHGNVRGSIVLGILSAYTMLQVIAVLRSLSKRPIYIDEQKEELVLRFGILSNAIIPFSSIEKTELSTKDIPEKSIIKFFSPIGRSGGHNIILHFNKEIKFNGFYGFKKKAKSLAIFVDEVSMFEKVLKDNLSKDN